VVFFSNLASAQSIAGGDPPALFFVRRGTDSPGIAHDWNPVKSTIDSLTPGGTTSIGAGINTAMSQWAADPDSDLSIIIVTDGNQNTVTLVETTPAASSRCCRWRRSRTSCASASCRSGASASTRRA
jgi:Mg-chelatase subunit ChlD